VAEAIPEKPSSGQVSGTVPWSEKGCWGGRPFGVFGTKGGKSVPRGHVKLKSTPCESHRAEIQLDKLDGDGCRAAQGRAVMDVWPLIWTPCSPLIMWTRLTARSAPHLHTVGPAFGSEAHHGWVSGRGVTFHGRRQRFREARRRRRWKSTTRGCRKCARM